MNQVSKLKVAVCFRRIGPYHVARLVATAEVFSGLVAIESTRVDTVYKWDEVDAGHLLKKITLFNDQDSLDVSKGEIRTRVSVVLDEIKPDVVVIHGWSENVAFAQLHWCTQNRVPSIVMSESQELDESRNWWVEYIKKQYVSLFYSGLCGGKSHKKYLNMLGLPVEDIFLGYDVVDNDYFSNVAQHARSNDELLRKEHKLPNNYFLSSNRFVPKKNLFSLINAYKRYRDVGAPGDWKLVMLGDGELKKDIVNHIKELCLTDHIMLPGFKQYSEIPIYYGLANVFVHTSMVEQWGLVVNEAMSCGLPVLVSLRCGSALELVKDEQNGFRINPGDEQEIAKHMIKMAAGEYNLSRMGDESKNIIAKWSPERFAQGLEKAVKIAVHKNIQRVGLVQWIILKTLCY